MVLDAAAEADVVGGLAAVELPGVAVLEPGLGQLDLVAVDDLLAEEAVAVADAVAVGRHADRRHALHEAGGEPPEAAVAERGVGLELGDLVEVDVEQLQRRAHRLGQPEVRDRVAHQPADQELEAEVVDPLLALEVGGAGRVHPVLDGAVAGDQDHRLQPVVRLGDLRVLADAVGQPLDDLAGEDLGIRRSGDWGGEAIGGKGSSWVPGRAGLRCFATAALDPRRRSSGSRDAPLPRLPFGSAKYRQVRALFKGLGSERGEWLAGAAEEELGGEGGEDAGEEPVERAGDARAAAQRGGEAVGGEDHRHGDAERDGDEERGRA